MDVVAEHRGEEGITERLHQLLRGDLANGGNPLQRFEHGRGLVAGGQPSGTNQRPQWRGALTALTAVLLGFEFDRIDRLDLAGQAFVQRRQHLASRCCFAIGVVRFRDGQHLVPAGDDHLLANGL